jgi:hypothetical protein
VCVTVALPSAIRWQRYRRRWTWQAFSPPSAPPKNPTCCTGHGPKKDARAVDEEPGSQIRTFEPREQISQCVLPQKRWCCSALSEELHTFKQLTAATINLGLSAPVHMVACSTQQLQALPCYLASWLAQNQSKPGHKAIGRQPAKNKVCRSDDAVRTHMSLRENQCSATHPLRAHPQQTLPGSGAWILHTAVSH